MALPRTRFSGLSVRSIAFLSRKNDEKRQHFGTPDNAATGLCAHYEHGIKIPIKDWLPAAPIEVALGL